MLSSLFEGIQLGAAQHHGSVAIYPLLSGEDWGPPYLSLGEALEAGSLSVAEVSASGSVPELKVVNGGDSPVLLLDSEELMGAKQNRVLNTTVLVAAKATVVIPVSCTEQGRWHSQSAHFTESSHCLMRGARVAKAASVTENLRFRRSHASDQGKVWEDIRGVAEEARVQSPTGAMSDVFSARGGDLKAYLDAFPRVPGQKGLLVFIKGHPGGMDLISREGAYARLHTKLVKSYCLEAALGGRARKTEVRTNEAEAFLRHAASCPGTSFPSPGLGNDFRFEFADLVGSALEVDGAVVHAAFFTRAQNPRGRREENLAGMRQRRDNRCSVSDPEA